MSPLIFLVPLFFVGIACSYTDIKYGKIKNNYIIIGLFSVVVSYSFLIFYDYIFFGGIENFSYFGKLLLNGLIALIISYLLWNFRMWTAADAKLFTVFSLLVPLEFYLNSYVPYFPSLLLLINIFIPLFLFLMVKAINFSVKELFKALKKFKLNKQSLGKIKIGIINTIKVYVGFILIFIVLQLAREKSNIFLNKIVPDPFLIFVLLFFGYRYIFSFFSRYKKISACLSFLGIAYSIYLLLSGQVITLLSILRFALIFMVAVGVLRKALDFYIEKKEILIISPNLLKKGMFPSSSFLNDEMRERLGSLRAEGLSEEQVEEIKKYNSKKIMVYKTFPFAPFMFAGVLITFFIRDSLLNVLFDFFGNLF